MSLIDQPKATRAEDALDINAVSAFVKSHYPNAHGALDIKQFPGGASNLTYQLNFDNVSLILRTSPKGTKAKGAHDMAREFRIMERLKPSYHYVPEMIALCSDEVLSEESFM